MSRQQKWGAEKTQEYFQNLVSNPTEEMIDIAKQDGMVMTFQEPLGATGQKFVKNLQDVPTARWIFPFVKTPVNLLKQSYMERTPIGLLSKQYRDDVFAGGARGQMARSKMITGTGLLYSAYQMAQNGILTGSDPTDPDVRRQRREAGWRPRSIVVDTPMGKQYISYDRMEPFSYIVGASVDIAEYMEATKYTVLGEEEEAVMDRMIDGAIVAAAENTLNKTFMTGMRDLMNVWSEPKRYASRYARRQADAMLPFSGARRNIKRTIDDTKYAQADEIGEYLTEQWSLLSSNMPKTVDNFGNEQKFDKVLSPWATSRETRSSVSREVERLAISTRMSGIPMFPKRLSGVKLDNVQYNEIKKYSRKEQELAGKNYIDTLSELMESSTYEDLIDDDKVQQIKNITIRFDQAALAKARENNVKLYNKTIQKDLIRPAKYKAKQEGMSESDALIELKDYYNK